MTQVFTTTGEVIPVTVIEIVTNYVLKVLTNEKNGYDAVQLATEPKRKNLVNKPDQGQFKQLKIKPQRFVKEIRHMTDQKVGAKLDASLFSPGEFIDATAISKGKGFSGVIKRYNFSRGPMGHGSGYHRGIGSMGSMRPKRVFKNKKMPGQHGNKQVTIQNLEIIAVNAAKNYLLVKGSTPGPKKQLVTIRSSVKQPAQQPATNLLVRQQPKKATQKLNKPLPKPKAPKVMTPEVSKTMSQALKTPLQTNDDQPIVPLTVAPKPVMPPKATEKAPVTPTMPAKATKVTPAADSKPVTKATKVVANKAKPTTPGKEPAHEN